MAGFSRYSFCGSVDSEASDNQPAALSLVLCDGRETVRNALLRRGKRWGECTIILAPVLALAYVLVLTGERGGVC